VHQIVAKAKKDLERRKLMKDWSQDPYENAWHKTIIRV
jgi:hypothetical protein